MIDTMYLYTYTSWTDNFIKCYINHMKRTRHVKWTFTFWEVSDFSSIFFFVFLSFIHSFIPFSPPFFRSPSHFLFIRLVVLTHIFSRINSLQFKNKFIHVCEYFWLGCIRVRWLYSIHCNWVKYVAFHIFI